MPKIYIFSHVCCLEKSQTFPATVQKKIIVNSPGVLGAIVKSESKIVSLWNEYVTVQYVGTGVGSAAFVLSSLRDV